jgi:membrane protease YdiL (CAAX protease family)
VEAIPIFLVAIVATTVLTVVGAQLVTGSGLEVLASAIFEVVLAAGVLLWLRWFHRPAIGALGLPRRPLLEMAKGLVGGVVTRLIAVFAIGPIVVLVLDWFTDGATRVPEQVPTDLEVLPTFLLGLVVVVAAPIGEELFFRGFLFRGLRARRGFWVSAIVSSVAFGLVHYVDGSWFFVPIMFMVGLCFAYLYEREGRILTPIVAHAAFNLIGILFLTLA